MLSSHASGEFIAPFPHNQVHVDWTSGVFVHVHPDSTAQALEHPSPEATFPSSQASLFAVTNLASPHVPKKVHTDKAFATLVHEYPDSTVHVEEHPSPLIAFPSSHTSPFEAYNNPSPQSR